MIYILSTGRASTNLLNGVLEQTNEEVQFGHQKRGSRLLNISGNWLIRRPNSYHYMEQLLWLIRGSRMPRSTVDPLLSIPIYIVLTSEENDSEASCPHKLIHLVRDPRDFVTSFINWKQQSNRRRFLHNYVPFWQPLPQEYPVIGPRKMSKFEQFCWVWEFKNGLFQSLEDESDHYLRIRMEDLVSSANDYAGVRRVLAFLGLSMDEDLLPQLLAERVNRSQADYFPRWQEWTSQQARILNRQCSDRMTTYGYGMEPEWRILLQSTSNSRLPEEGWLG